MPKTRTKQAATSAAVNASNVPTAGTRIFNPHCGRTGLMKTAWNASHSETKPFNGGSAAIATAASRKAAEDIGIRWINPPSTSMLRVPVAFSTAPAPKNKTLLNSMWLNA